MKNINYEKLKNEIIDILNKLNTIILATSDYNRVTARTISIVNDKLIIYCQTDSKFMKCEQIVKNPNIALSINNIQIEAEAKIKGHPLLDENKEFTKLFKMKHQDSYNMYSHLESEVVIEFIPRLITLWKYNNDKPFRDFLDIKEKKAFREFYMIN
jgi:general stress protein 26